MKEVHSIGMMLEKLVVSNYRYFSKKYECGTDMNKAAKPIRFTYTFVYETF